MLANDLQLGDLFAQRSPFQVPKYQRSYAWGEEEIKDFVRDLDLTLSARQGGTPKEHFFGGVVCLHYSAQNALGRKYEVIDGQQRLATFALFFARLCYWNNLLAGECRVAGEPDNARLAEARAERIRNNFLEFDDELDGKPVQQQRIVLSKADKDFFAAVISGTCPTPVRESHRLLLKANDAIDAFVKGVIDAQPDNQSKLATLDHLLKTATEDCHIVHLVSQTKGEAYRLFQVLNDRGRSLSEGDLLRSTTLEWLEGAATSQDQAEKIWDEILSARASHIERFLRSYYASRMGKRAGHRTLFDDFLRDIFPSHNAASVIKTLKEMYSAHLLFNCLVEGEWPYESTAVALWDRNRLKLLVSVLKNELCLPLLLATCRLTEKNFSAVVHLVELIVFRHIHCCRQHPSKLDSVFLSQATEINKRSKTYKIASLRSALKSVQDSYSNDTVFREGIRSELVYRERAGNTVVKYFLTTLDQFHSWYSSGATGNPKCKDKTAVYDLSQVEIEHVYPRKAATPDPAMEPLKNHLGNLSVWGPNDNTKAANQSFTLKKKLYASSKVTLNQDLAKLSKFEEKELQERENDLIKFGLSVFRM